MTDNDNFMKFLIEREEVMEIKAGQSQDWYSIDRKLDNKLFLRFLWNKFNIYYLLLILFTFCISLSTTIHYIFHVHKLNTSDVSNNEIRNDQIAQDTITNPGAIRPEEKKDITSFIKKSTGTHQENTKEFTDKIIMEKQTEETDTLQEESVSEKLLPLPEQQQLQPQVKRIVIIKQDTIFKTDSVKVKSRRKLFRKNSN